eukprot:1233427-Lingulodinium_polyedra.AAC.1
MPRVGVPGSLSENEGGRRRPFPRFHELRGRVGRRSVAGVVASYVVGCVAGWMQRRDGFWQRYARRAAGGPDR